MIQRLLIGTMSFLLVLGMVTNSHASLFSDNFESGLSQWTSTNGQIVADPLNGTNHVLHFIQNKSGGDAFTLSSFALTPGVTYTFSFDYLGTISGSPPQAYAGISPTNTTVPTAGWVFASVAYGNAQLLTNDNTWHSYTFSFSDSFLNSIGGSTVYLTFQQAAGSVGTAYFDNVSLTAVPIPAALWLLGSGLIGLAGVRRFRK